MAAKRRRGSRKRKAPVKNLRWWLFTIAAAVCLLVDVLADQGLIPGWDELGGAVGNRVPQQSAAVPETVLDAVHFIDVGQGDSVILQSAGHYALIDAGVRDSKEAILDYLDSLGVTKLDYVFMTHPHADHIGSMAAVLKQYEIGQMILPNIDNGPEPTTSTYERVLDMLDEKRIPTTCASPEDTYSLGNGCITILGDGVKTDNLNNTSTALRFDANGLSLVATGDGEKEVEKQLLAAKKKELQADVYKAAHHGSSTSNTLEFLQAVSPQVVVVSCGKDNSYGHPHKEAMQNFAAVGAQVLRTDELGSIAVWEQEGEVHYACTAGKDAA